VEFYVSKAKITREETKVGDTIYSSIIIEGGNAYIVFLSEGQDNLGTLAASLPQKPGMIGPLLSSTLLGERNQTLARLLAERLAKSLNKMVVVSVFVKAANERKAGHIFLKLLEKTLKKVEPQDES
jgi:hypothetical protein